MQSIATGADATAPIGVAADGSGLDGAIGRTLDLWCEPQAWRRVQANGWQPRSGGSPAAQHAALYRGFAKDSAVSCPKLLDTSPQRERLNCARMGQPIQVHLHWRAADANGAL